MHTYIMSMKIRVTFTLDPDISHKAKAFARARKQSLSSLVQSLLTRELGASKPPAKTKSFSSRWAGTMKVADKTDERFLRLKTKHKL